MQKQGASHPGEHTGDAADDKGHHLLEIMGDADPVENSDRCQQSDEVADQQNQNANVKQVRSPHHLASAKKLARLGAPGVLLGRSE